MRCRCHARCFEVLCWRGRRTWCLNPGCGGCGTLLQCLLLNHLLPLLSGLLLARCMLLLELRTLLRL